MGGQLHYACMHDYEIDHIYDFKIAAFWRKFYAFEKLFLEILADVFDNLKLFTVNLAVSPEHQNWFKLHVATLRTPIEC